MASSIASTRLSALLVNPTACRIRASKRSVHRPLVCTRASSLPSSTFLHTRRLQLQLSHSPFLPALSKRQPTATCRITASAADAPKRSVLPPAVAYLAAVAVTASLRVARAAEKFWKGPGGGSLRRQAVGFALAAVPVVLAGVFPPLANAAPSRYARDNTGTQAALQFATVILLSIQQVLFIFRGLLFLRIVLTWFPNLPWDRQPLAAIRELSDPYLNMFKNIIPPVMGTLDVSPLAAFAVMGLFEMILTGQVDNIRRGQIDYYSGGRSY